MLGEKKPLVIVELYGGCFDGQQMGLPDLPLVLNVPVDATGYVKMLPSGSTPTVEELDDDTPIATFVYDSFNQMAQVHKYKFTEYKRWPK